MRYWTGLLAFTLLLGGCSVTRTDFPVRTESVQAEVEELASNVTIVRLTADNISGYSAPRNLAGPRTTMPGNGSWDYRIGVGDVLDIVVWEHSDLTMPAGERRTPAESGLRVQSDGTFFYPYVGQVEAKGRSPEQVRVDLMTRLAEYIPNPQIEVRVVSYKSQAVSVTGEVKSPSRQPLTDVPLTLLDAINAAGGLNEQADPRGVTVRRGGKTYNVDLEAFLKNGVGANNPPLRNGDVVTVPKLELQEAYLLGQIETAQTVDLTKDNVTLTQAIARSGGLKEDQADARGIFVFRNVNGSFVVYQLDASNPAAYLIGSSFMLHPKDVIYITSSPMHRWNRLISSLLPTITTVRTANDI